MKRKIIAMLLLAVLLLFGITACEKKEEKSLDASKIAKKLAELESEAEDSGEADKPVKPKKDRTDVEMEESIEEPEGISFKEFSGNYYFSSGAGGWSTDVVINEDGSFTGIFQDFDMGITDEEYPNGTVSICEFSGKFSELTKKDEFTYTCSLEEITQEEEEGTERISKEDGYRYIYSFPYGFDDGKDFEFYLPGKSVGDCDPEFLSWMSLRYNDPYPDTLLNKAFNNLSNMYGFDETIDYSQEAEAVYPESLPLPAYELAGSYANKNLGIEMHISVYTAQIEEGDALGNITWEIPEDVYIGNDEGMLYPSDNGYDVKLEYFGGYKIIVTDNTSEKVVIHLYDDRGRDCGEYVMTQHYVS